MPLSFNDIWAQLVKNDPRLKDPEASIIVRTNALKLLLEQVYDQGAKASEASTGSPPSPFKNVRTSPFG